MAAPAGLAGFSPRRLLAGLAVVGCLAAGAVAVAAEGDRASAENVLREVEASPRKAVAAELTLRARAALERATKLRAAGDETHARMADALARTWAEAARDAVRAAVVEDTAAAARREATDAGAMADRERALLEEAIAQSGRLRAQVDSASHPGQEQPAKTSAAANSDAGTKAPPSPKAAPKDARDGGVR